MPERPSPERLPSGRRGLPREFVVESQRGRILDAIADACAEKGYSSVTVADIVRRAQVSRTTFYELFKGKEACFLAAFDAILSRFLADTIRAYEREEMSWAERVRAGLEVMLDFLSREPSFARICIVDVLFAGPRAFERYRSAVRVITTYLDEGRHHAPGREGVPASTATAAVGGGVMVVREEILAGRVRQLPELLPELLYAALAPYLGQEEALREIGRAPSTGSDGGAPRVPAAGESQPRPG
jgi:AcrR family transcriptional regulator